MQSSPTPPPDSADSDSRLVRDEINRGNAGRHVGTNESRSSDLPLGPASQIPWAIIVGCAMGLAFLSHLNRVAMSVAADERIMPQYGISTTEMGTVYSAFLVVYAITMIPGGMFIDRFGPRTALIAMGCTTAPFAVLTGMTSWLAIGHMWIGLVIVRGAMGMCTTPLHPGCARAVSFWVPRHRRALANGLVSGAAVLGVACTYSIVGTLIDHFDWPATFVILGIGLGIVTLGWALAAPKNRFATNSDATSPVTSGSRTPLFRNRSLILLTFSYGALSYFQYMFFYWMHYYFSNVLQLGKDESRFYASLPTLAMAITMPLGGWMSDYAVRIWGPRIGRKTVPAGGMVFSAVFLVLGLMNAANTTLLVLYFTFALGALGISEGPFWTMAVALGRERGGTAAAILNTGSNGFGLLAPIVTPAVSAILGWQWGIGVGGLVCLLGAACWWGVKVDGANSEARAT